MVVVIVSGGVRHSNYLNYLQDSHGRQPHSLLLICSAVDKLVVAVFMIHEVNEVLIHSFQVI